MPAFTVSPLNCGFDLILDEGVSFSRLLRGVRSPLLLEDYHQQMFSGSSSDTKLSNNLALCTEEDLPSLLCWTVTSSHKDQSGVRINNLFSCKFKTIIIYFLYPQSILNHVIHQRIPLQLQYCLMLLCLVVVHSYNKPFNSCCYYPSSFFSR